MAGGAGSQEIRTADNFKFAKIKILKNLDEEAVEKLRKLRQLSNVRIYKSRFQEIVDTTQNVPDEFLIKCFINGLRDEIKAGVRRFQPYTMDQTIGLALPQEMSIWSTNSEIKSHGKNLIFDGSAGNQMSNSKTVLDFQCDPNMHCKESKELEEGVSSWNYEDSDYEESDDSKVVVKNKEIIIQIDDVLKPDKDYDRKNDCIKYAGYEEESYDGQKSLDGRISSYNSSDDESYANEKNVVVVELGKLKADVPCMKTHPLFHLEIVSKEKIPKSDSSSVENDKCSSVIELGIKENEKIQISGISLDVLPMGYQSKEVKMAFITDLNSTISLVTVGFAAQYDEEAINVDIYQLSVCSRGHKKVSASLFAY